MKNLLVVIVAFCSCNILKPNVPVPAPVPVPRKVPNVMSRSIVPGSSERTLYDSVLAITKRMDTIIYNTEVTVKYKNKMIDTLWVRQVLLQEANEAKDLHIKKLEKTISEMNWIRFNPQHFTLTQIGDTTEVSKRP